MRRHSHSPHCLFRSIAALAITLSSIGTGAGSHHDASAHSTLWLPAPSSANLNLVSQSSEPAGPERLRSGLRFTVALTQTQYTLTDLGVDIHPHGINDRGQIVGEGAFAPGCREPALWDAGILIRLEPAGGECGVALDINENGQIVGYIQDAGGVNRAFLWRDANQNGQTDPTEMIALGTLGGADSRAWAINDAGVVVGDADDNNEVQHAFRWENGMVDIHPGLDGDESYATDINNAGVIVGLERVHDTIYWRAYKRNGNATALGALGKENGAYAINNFSQISGYISYDNGPLNAFLWLPQPAYGLPAGMNDLGVGAAGEFGYGLNDAGQVIGSGGAKAYVWQAGTLTILNDLLPANSGWTLFGPTGINNKGQIVGTGLYQGQVHGYLLSPRPWTLLFYLAGDNNLASSYGPIFQRLEATANLPGVSILVFWDSNGNGDSGYYEVQYDTDLTQFADYTEGVNYWPLGEVNTGASFTLSDFVIWGIQRAPSAHFALILDDHGSGLGGLAWDDTSNEDRITLPELKLALSTAADQTQRKIDVLYMAMCLMGMLEDAYQVRDLADYYVASEHLQTTYQDYLNGFSADLSPQQAALGLASAYAAEMTAKGKAYTISAVDLSKLTPVVDATNQLGQALATPMGVISGTITTIASLVQRFDNKSPSGSITTADTYVDLTDFATLVEQNLSSEAEIVAAAQAVKDAIGAYVLYESHSSDATYVLDNSAGVSIFFPATASSFYNPSNYDFAVGADWGSSVSTAGSAGPATSWGGFLVDYFQATQPGGTDDSTPPLPLPKLSGTSRLYLPHVIRLRPN